MTKPISKLKVVADLAGVLDNPEVADIMSPAMRRAFEDTADAQTKTWADAGVPVTVDTIYAAMSGAALEALIAADSNPMASMFAKLQNPSKTSTGPDGRVMAVLSVLARRVLTGTDLPAAP